jgi:hypothetical protein
MPPEPRQSTPQVHAAAVHGGDHCPSCGALLASDQRYCLECGQRRGDPRLPFMDAVVLMEAVKQPGQAPPPAPKKKRTGISPNAALIAGIGVLLLALGIGVLIGRSGNNEAAAPAQQAPIVVHTGGGSEESTASTGKSTTGGGAASKTKTKKQKEAALQEAEKHPPAEKVLHTAPGVKLPPPTAKLGEHCENGTAGCEHGKQTGNFFK